MSTLCSVGGGSPGRNTISQVSEQVLAHDVVKLQLVNKSISILYNPPSFTKCTRTYNFFKFMLLFHSVVDAAVSLIFLCAV